MDGFLSSFGGNLHIVRRLVSGFVVFGFVALAYSSHLDFFSSSNFWTNVNANSTLVAMVFLLSAYLVGSTAEYAGNNFLLFFASVLAQAFSYPLRKMRWLPLPFRMISVLFWWMIVSLASVPFTFVRRITGVTNFKHQIAVHLDASAKSFFQELSPAVRYGLEHPVSVHFDHAMEDILHKCGDRRNSMEQLLGRQNDFSAIFASVLAGVIFYICLTLFFLSGSLPETQTVITPPDSFEDSQLPNEEAPSFEQLDLDPAVEPPSVLPPESYWEDSALDEDMFSDQQSFFVGWDFSIFGVNASLLKWFAILPLLMSLSFIFLQFRRNAVVSVVQAASAATNEENEPVRSQFFSMYKQPRTSKATKLVTWVFGLACILCIPIEVLRWNFADVDSDSLIVLTFLLMPEAVRSLIPASFGDFVFEQVYWAAFLAIAVFSYLHLFRSNLSGDLATNFKAALVFGAAYLFVQILVRGLEVIALAEANSILKDFLKAARHAVGFSIAGLFCYLSIKTNPGHLFARLRSEFELGYMIKLVLVMFVFEFSFRLLANGAIALLPPTAFLNLSWLLREIGYFGAPAVGLVLSSAGSSRSKFYRMRHIAIQILWFAAAIWIFNQPTFDHGFYSMSGINFYFFSGLRFEFGYFFLYGLGALMTARVLQYYCLPNISFEQQYNG